MIKNVGKKKYLVRVYAPGPKRRSVSKVIYGPRDAAEAYELELKQRRSQGQPLTESRLTVAEFFDQWKGAIRERVRERTLNWYAGQFDNHIRPHLGHLKLVQLTPLEIETFYADKLKSGLSGRSVESFHSVLSSMYADAVRWQAVKQSPLRYVRMPKRRKVEMLSFTPEEAQRFIKATYSSPYGLPLRFALKTGLRPEEYLGLKWADIDFEYRDREGRRMGRVHVRQTVVPGKPGGGWWWSEPKSQNGYREVLLPVSLLQELKEHRAAQLSHRMSLGEHYQNHDLVFATPRGTPVDARSLSFRMFKSVLKEAGLSTSFRLYDLRHSWVTLSILAGADLKTVSRQAGHASVAFTLQVYGHVLPQMRETAADKLEALLVEANRTK